MGGLFGSSVSGVPDLNGDGLGDVIVVAENEQGGYLELARVYILDGATGRVLRQIYRPSGNLDTAFGAAVAGLADVNGDGLGDVVVGGHMANYVYDGSNGGLLHTHESPNGGGGFGRNVGAISDVNGDGRGDIIAGGVGEGPGWPPENAGRAYVFSGATGEVLFALVSPNEQKGGEFGGPVSSVPDLTGDGYDDVIVGATGEGPETALGEHAGRVYVFDGANGSLLHTLLPPEEPKSAPFGSALSGIPDLTGDGKGDIAVSASSWPQGTGKVYVFDGASGSLLLTLMSTNESGRDYFGWSICGLADVSGDGLGDLAVSDAERGEAYVFDGVSGTVLHWFLAPQKTVMRGEGGAGSAGVLLRFLTQMATVERTW
ncbi:MAG TPA: VCBS repeat-containing protein [Sumerlaeia bacterium]|nr:VCBS repeat-containing protein [Sumerlaeia bacterium]